MAVYTGVWYNHEADKLVLTLDPTAAGFLSAAIVTFVSVVATATWPLLRYVLYALRCNLVEPKDVFHHQRQILLRNSANPGGASWQLLMMMLGWNRYRLRAMQRSIVYFTVCLSVFVLWIVCGLYAPYIYTRTESEVLLKASPYCGSVTPVDVGMIENRHFFNKIMEDEFNTVNAADTYVQRCYERNDTTNSCLTYPSQTLPFDLADEQVCPFGPDGSACVTENSTVVTLDTGYLDSNRHFGINAAAAERVRYRRQTTCSPLHSAGWVSVYNTSGTPLGDLYQDAVLWRYRYGPAHGEDYTFQYNVMQATYPIPYSVQ